MTMTIKNGAILSPLQIRQKVIYSFTKSCNIAMVVLWMEK